MELGSARVVEEVRFKLLWLGYFLFPEHIVNRISIQQLFHHRGVYKPVRSKFSRFTASMSTFIASGVFHEWLLSGES